MADNTPTTIETSGLQVVGKKLNEGALEFYFLWF
jgi:hypothetical protein